MARTQRADVVDRMGIAAQQRRDADIAAHLHDIGDAALLGGKSRVLGRCIRSTEAMLRLG